MAHSLVKADSTLAFTAEPGIGLVSLACFADYFQTFAEDTFIALVNYVLTSPLQAIAGIAVVTTAALYLAKKYTAGKSEREGVQRTLDALPDAVALFSPAGRLTALNFKLAKLMPLKQKPLVFEDTGTRDLYAQISPDIDAIEQARTEARAAAPDLDSTISFELPSYDQRSLTVKERPTSDGGIAVSIHGSAKLKTKQFLDALTSLPNRTRLLHELAHRCSRAKNELSLITVDLRSFRQINDTYGREAGDELLVQTALCIQENMPKNAFIARTAGDEFAILLESNTGRLTVERCVSELLRVLRKGVNVNEMNVPVRASVGIAYAPEHGNTVSSLLAAADSACANAKHQTDNTLVVYNSILQQQAKRRHQLEVGLQKAIENNELALQYQPQVDIETKMTYGMEALVRWHNPAFGTVSPDDFIPVAEDTGIINQLGNWVMRQAVSDYQRLATFGMYPAVLSVNLSRKQFENGQIVADVKALLDSTGFNPNNLCFEITETALTTDVKHLHNQLLDLTSLGVRLAIDDFGVGYTSLRELRDFPISEVKIDRAFITDIATDRHSQDIVAAVVDISRSIGADVVAEGIETKGQFDKVAELGCDRAQGFYLSHPMAATTFPDVVLSS